MKKNAMRYNTNLAAEFWVLSTLYRLGIDAHLTLGNKKSVDILIYSASKGIFTVDVKGVAKPYDWPADNIKIFNNPNHVYTLLCFDGKILDPLAIPSVWIIPSNEIQRFVKPYTTRSVVSRAILKRDGSKFKDAWRYFYQLADAEFPLVST